MSALGMCLRETLIFLVCSSMGFTGLKLRTRVAIASEDFLTAARNFDMRMSVWHIWHHRNCVKSEINGFFLQHVTDDPTCRIVGVKKIGSHG